MAEPIRWGILGTGNIARKFAEGLEALDDARLVAVGSRTQEAADAFGDEFDVPHRHASYEALASDPEVDAIYVATPHVFHAENAALCIDHGKAVLCEKPFAINEAQAKPVFDAAAAKGVLVMEATLTHFFPAIDTLVAPLRGGPIGEVRQVKADFCFRAGWNPDGRLLNPQLGGGGLLDVGVYCVSFAQLIMGREPATVAGVADIVETGVDGQAGLVFGYDDGAFALLSCACRTGTPHEAMVVGTEGYIRIPHLFWQPDRIVLHKGGEEETFAYERLGNGYSYEARAVGECLRAGATTSTVMPPEKTLAVLRTLDRVRAQWNLTYPMEA